MSKSIDDIPEEKFKELQEAFAMFDLKDTGCITSGQLCSTMESLGLCPTEASVRHMISVADTDGNGLIDFREFVNLMTSRRRQSIDNERELRDAFRALDKQGTGFVGPDSLRAAMSGLTGESVTDAEVKAMIRKADKDGDGKLNYEEFSDYASPIFGRKKKPGQGQDGQGQSPAKTADSKSTPTGSPANLTKDRKKTKNGASSQARK